MSSSCKPTTRALPYRPQAQWKDAWAQRLLALSPTNRLPRGFRNPQPELNPVIVPEAIGWLDNHKAAISEAVHGLAPLGPSLLTGRGRSKRKSSTNG